MTRTDKAMIKAMASVLAVALGMAILMLTVGCGNQTQTYTGPTWYDAGPFQYRFPNAYQCILRVNGEEIAIPRHMEEGENELVEWEWEEDGDIDIEFAGRDFDLDSPFDFDYDTEYEGYEDIGGGFVMVWIGGKLVKKDKAWLAKNPKYNKQYKPMFVQTTTKATAVKLDKNGKPVPVSRIKTTTVASARPLNTKQPVQTVNVTRTTTTTRTVAVVAKPAKPKKRKKK